MGFVVSLAYFYLSAVKTATIFAGLLMATAAILKAFSHPDFLFLMMAAFIFTCLMFFLFSPYVDFVPYNAGLEWYD